MGSAEWVAAGNAPVLSQVAAKAIPFHLTLPSSECRAGAEGDATVTFTLCLPDTWTVALVAPALLTDVEDEQLEEQM